MPRNVTILVALFAGVLVIAACSKGLAGDTFTPAPRAVNATQASVEFDAIAWANRSPETRTWSTVQATHSMEPFVNEHSIVLLEKYKGQPLTKGSVVVFNRGDVSNVIHVVVDQTADSVYMSGYNNHSSDGWFPKSTIQYVLVGQLYLP